jgi:hypothetical protein
VARARAGVGGSPKVRLRVPVAEPGRHALSTKLTSAFNSERVDVDGVVEVLWVGPPKARITEPGVAKNPILKAMVTGSYSVSRQLLSSGTFWPSSWFQSNAKNVR